MKEQTYFIKSANESNDKDRIVIIDNTPFPHGGAIADASIVLEYGSSSSYVMSYNLRSTSIYMAIICTILAFAIGMVSYLTLKLNKDIQRVEEKLNSELEEEEEEEEYEDEEDKEEGEDPDKEMNEVDL